MAEMPISYGTDIGPRLFNSIYRYKFVGNEFEPRLSGPRRARARIARVTRLFFFASSREEKYKSPGNVACLCPTKLHQLPIQIVTFMSDAVIRDQLQLAVGLHRLDRKSELISR